MSELSRAGRCYLIDSVGTHHISSEAAACSSDSCSMPIRQFVSHGQKFMVFLGQQVILGGAPG